MKEPIRYPSENRLTLLVPAKNTMAKVNQINPIRTIRFRMSSHDLNNKVYNLKMIIIIVYKTILS